MGPKLILVFIFICSSNHAQNNFKQFSHLVEDIICLDKINNNRITLFQPDDNIFKHHSFINLSGQAIIGSVFAAGFSILPLAATVANAWGSDGTRTSRATLGVALSILTISSYVFGSAVGVHLIAKSENTELSFWGTVGYSAIGGGAGIVLLAILASQYETIPGGGAIVIFFPLIGSMVYASFISDWPQENQKISFYKNNISHKDLIEQTKLFNIELLRIKL